jgi:hypothetical protein
MKVHCTFVKGGTRSAVLIGATMCTIHFEVPPCPFKLALAGYIFLEYM